MKKGDVHRVLVMEALDPENVICRPADGTTELSSLASLLAVTYEGRRY